MWILHFALWGRLLYTRTLRMWIKLEVTISFISNQSMSFFKFLYTWSNYMLLEAWLNIKPVFEGSTLNWDIKWIVHGIYILSTMNKKCNNHTWIIKCTTCTYSTLFANIKIMNFSIYKRITLKSAQLGWYGNHTSNLELATLHRIFLYTVLCLD